MKYVVHGKIFQNLEVILDKGESILAEPGKLVWMDRRVGMDTFVHGGIIDGVMRKLSGEKFMVTKFYGKEDNAHLVLRGEYAGEIVPFNITENSVIARKNAFVAGEETVKVTPHLMPSIGYSVATGEKVFQKLSGKGYAFVSVKGEMTTIKIDGNELYVHLPSVVAFDSTVKLTIAPIPGIKNMLFAKSGIIMAKLSGKGRILLQNF